MASLSCHPFFLDGAHGALFAVHHGPPPGQPVKGQLLCVPPFNEEMNRCRSMITLQARTLAAQGWGTLLVDLHGTGDSAGEFVEARWAHWLEDIAAAWSWLSQQPGSRRALWGIRLGAILATQSHGRIADATVPLLLWQPVSDGKTHLTQFLRVKIAAQMDRTDLPKETTTTMRAQLNAGQTVEVGGYELHPELTHAIDAATLGAQRLAAGSQVLWLENAPADKPELSPATQMLLQKWPGPGVSVLSRTYEGPAYWQVHERVLAPSVVDVSTRWLVDGTLP